MKHIFLLIVALFTTQLAQAQFGKLKDKAKQVQEKAQDKLGGTALSQEEVGKALKEALNNGVGSATDFLSAKDGYLSSQYKILLPEEAQMVVSKVSKVPGFNNIEQDLTERMNRAAEDAAVKAKPIFLKAIKSMSFQDATNILMGDKDAATQFLHSATYQSLYDEFLPVIQTSLDKVKAREYWRGAVTAYNKIPLTKKTNPELDDHVTSMALVGLFDLVKEKEAGIRADKSLRNTDLLKKVFAKQDNK